MPRKLDETDRERGSLARRLITYKVSQVSTLLQSSPNGIKRLIHTGKLKAFYLGMEFRIPGWALEEYERQAVAGRPERHQFMAKLHNGNGRNMREALRKRFPERYDASFVSPNQPVQKEPPKML